MYVLIANLFLIPLAMLGFAWHGELVKRKDVSSLDWRSLWLRLALITGDIATASSMISSFSRTHNGGSPHGLMPPAGLWLTIRPIVKWSILTTLAIGIFAKGKGRLLAMGSAISIVIIICVLAVLEMD